MDGHQPGSRDFRIVTPGNWYVLDLNPATRNASMAALVERRFGRSDDPQLVQARRELTALLRGAARDAQENGAVHAAVMDVLVDGVALSASLTVVLGDAPVDQDGNPAVDPAALSQLLLATELTEALTAALRPTAAPEGGSGPNGAPAPGGPAPGGAEGEQTAEGDEPAEMVALPAGPAVRVRRITGSGVAGSTGATAETQYFVAVPGTAKMLVLTFATPNVDYRWHFEELFDRIAQTLEWTGT